MKLLEQIKADLQTARVAGAVATRTTLQVLIGEIELKKSKSKKDWTDEDTVVSAKAMAKNLKSMVDYGKDDAQIELDVISVYIPTELTYEQIVDILYQPEGLTDEIIYAEQPMRLMGKIKKVVEADGRPFNGGVLKDAVMAIYNGVK